MVDIKKKIFKKKKGMQRAGARRARRALDPRVPGTGPEERAPGRGSKL